MNPISRRQLLAHLTAGAASLAGPTELFAQTTWPNRPIKMMIPFPPGGATDIIGRALAARLSSTIGLQVVVDNKPGAGGIIGAELAAKAAPDGYTILLATSSTHSVGAALNPKLPYDATRDFVPVSLVARAPSVLVVGANFPAKTVGEFVSLLKSKPGKYNFGSSGIGTYPHLSAEMFKWRAGNLYAVHIPYRGTGLVIPDLVTGEIAFLMDSVVSAQTHIKDGKVRPLAVSGAHRSVSLPDVPTFTEAGIPGMDISNWFGFLLPVGASAEVINRFNSEVNAALKAPEVIERLVKVGAEPSGGTPEQLKEVIRKDYESWKALIARAGIKPE